MSLDQREFERHSEKFSYPEKLIQVLKYTSVKTLKQLQEREYPFQMHIIQQLYQQFIKEKKFLF
jgi:protein associated with RNAse G/E